MHIYTYIYIYEGHVAPSSRMSDSVFQLDAGCDSGGFPDCASWAQWLGGRCVATARIYPCLG